MGDAETLERCISHEMEEYQKKKGLRDVFWVTKGTEFSSLVFLISCTEQIPLWTVSQTFSLSALKDVQSLVHAMSAAWHEEASPMLCSLLQVQGLTETNHSPNDHQTNVSFKSPAQVE